MYMNIDILKQRPIPQEKQQFELLLPDKKPVTIVDKRGDVNIDRHSILERIRNRVVVQKEEPHSLPVATKKKSNKQPDENKTESEPQSNQEASTSSRVAQHFKKQKEDEEEDITDQDDKVEFMDINERLPQEKEKVIMHASSYYMNNRKLFVRKINELFKEYNKELKSNKSNISCDQKQEAEFDLLTHQKIVRDYINLYSPYRGILLYHGLGSGKTCSSIALAEGMKSDKRIVIMTPASLKMNFFSELKKCGDLMYKKNQFWEFVSIKNHPEHVSYLSKALNLSREYIRRKKGAWLVDARKNSNFGSKSATEQKAIDDQINEMIRVKYTDLNYNGMNDKQLEKLTGKYTYNPFDNSVIIIDEAHNFVSRIVNKIKSGQKKSLSMKLYDYLLDAQNAKIILLSGTPVINYPNELGVLFNLLRGYIKTWTFPLEIQSTAKINHERFLEMFDKEGFNVFDYVEYSNNKLVITRNPFGFVNAKKRGVLKGTRMKGGDSEGKEHENDIIEKAEPLKDDNQEDDTTEEQDISDDNNDSDPQEVKPDEDSQEITEEGPVDGNDDQPDVQEDAQQDTEEDNNDQEIVQEETEDVPEEPIQQADEELEQEVETKDNVEQEEDDDKNDDVETVDSENDNANNDNAENDNAENIDELKKELEDIKGQMKELQENNALALERKEIHDQQEKELKQEIKNMEQEAHDKQEEDENTQKEELLEDEDNSFYGAFERNANVAREFLKKNIGYGGAGTRKSNKSNNKRSTRKSGFANKIDSIDIDDDKLKELIERFYREGYNHEFHPHNGGAQSDRPYFDKYNGVRIDSDGNISDDDFVETIVKILKKNRIQVNMNRLTIDKYTALPDDPKQFNEMFVDVDKGKIVNENLFKRRILGLSSYFRSAQEGLMPKIIKTEDNQDYFLIESTMSDHQFGYYEKVRKEEADQEEKNRKKQRFANMNPQANKEDPYKMSSTYRIFSRASCNFVFPVEIERPLPKKKDIDENEIDGVKKKDLKSDDNFNEADGDNIDEDNDYQKQIVKALKSLSKKDRKGNSLYLNPEKLALYSPKFLKLLENLQHVDNKGLHLIYSQFRTIEGIGILKLILEANGYAEFKIKKTSSGWQVVQKIGDETKPKFVLYTGTESEDEKEIIRNVYNSNWDVIPVEIAQHVKKIHKNNFMGEIIRVFMITASGAEGINLKNTQYVHIVEPYWHMVRMRQVIGRARRICSHEDLPKQMRNVKIYVYVSSLTQEQKTNDRHKELQIRDTSRKDGATPVTTDETLYEISTLKENINTQLLQAVKSSAFDCQLYANTKGDENVVCYNLGKITSNEFNSVPDIDVDRHEKDELNKRTIEWTAQEIKYRNKVYALNTDTKEIYNMEDYEKAVSGEGDLVDKQVGYLEYVKNKPKIVLK